MRPSVGLGSKTERFKGHGYSSLMKCSGALETLQREDFETYKRRTYCFYKTANK